MCTEQRILCFSRHCFEFINARAHDTDTFSSPRNIFRVFYARCERARLRDRKFTKIPCTVSPSNCRRDFSHPASNIYGYSLMLPHKPCPIDTANCWFRPGLRSLGKNCRIFALSLCSCWFQLFSFLSFQNVRINPPVQNLCLTEFF